MVYHGRISSIRLLWREFFKRIVLLESVCWLKVKWKYVGQNSAVLSLRAQKLFDEQVGWNHTSRLFVVLARVLARAKTKALDFDEFQADSFVFAQTITCACIGCRSRCRWSCCRRRCSWNYLRSEEIQSPRKYLKKGSILTWIVKAISIRRVVIF